MTEEEIREHDLVAYDLHDAGWAEVSFRAASERLGFAVSYLHDSLGDLARMGLTLKMGAEHAEAVFMVESQGDAEAAEGIGAFLGKRKADFVALRRAGGKADAS